MRAWQKIGGLLSNKTGVIPTIGVNNANVASIALLERLVGCRASRIEYGSILYRCPYFPHYNLRPRVKNTKSSNGSGLVGFERKMVQTHSIDVANTFITTNNANDMMNEVISYTIKYVKHV